MTAHVTGPPDVIYLIRHGEKPLDTDEGAQGIDASGRPNKHSLTPRGWQRCGALGLLFTHSAQRGGAELQRPDHLLCPDYDGPATTPLHRSHQTLQALAGLTGHSIDFPFPVGDEGRLADGVLADRPGVVLICWEHHRIPDIAARLPSSRGAGVPAEWPDDRFDLIWQFRRAAGGELAYDVRELPQHVLAGDLDAR